MLNIDSELATLLQSSHEAEYRVTGFYGGALTEVVPVTADGSLTFNGSAVVQCNGTVFVAKDDARSLVPKSKTDTLAPFGQELRIDRVEKVGGREWVTTMGQLRIVEIPTSREFFKRFPSRVAKVGWSLQVKLEDRFNLIDGDDFLYPESPKPGNTTLEEIQRLSPIPVVNNPSIPDRAVPGGLAYPDSRRDALTLLYSNLGAYPSLTRFGSLTGRVKDAWLTETVPVFTLNGVIDMDDSLSNNLYNAVQVKSSTGSNELVRVKQLDDPGDPLSVNGPLGRRVYKYSSPLLTTQAQVDAAATTVLARVSTRQSKTVKITCLPQPHLELGDYIRVIDGERQVDGEISGMNASLDPTQSWSLEMIVAESR